MTKIAVFPHGKNLLSQHVKLNPLSSILFAISTEAFNTCHRVLISAYHTAFLSFPCNPSSSRHKKNNWKRAHSPKNVADVLFEFYFSTADANTMEKQCKESDRSSNISDLKLDLRTGSSNSNVHCDMDYIPGAESETGSESVITRIGVPLAGPVNVAGQEIYRYSADYTEHSFPKVNQPNLFKCRFKITYLKR